MLTYPVGTLNPKVSSIPTDQLVGAWLCDGDFNDSSGNGNDGTISGATFVNNRHGTPNAAISFDGVADFVSILDDPVLDMGIGSFSLCLWFKSNQVTADARFTDKRGLGVSVGYNMFLGGSGTPVLAMTSSTVNGPVNQNDDNWHFIVGVRDADAGEIFIYTDLTKSTPNSLVINNLDNATDLFFGKSSAGGKQYDGELDDIRFYKKVLTLDEITILFNE